MDAGKLKERIIIQKFENTIDYEGFNTEGWVDYYKCWCAHNKVNEKEFYSAMSLQTENIVTFSVRYSEKIKTILDDPNVTKSYRVIYKGREYDIKFINDIKNYHKYVDIKAESIL